MGTKEKQLTFLIAIVAVAVGAILGYSELAKYKQSLANSKRRLSQELQTQNAILAEAPDWDAFANWLDRNSPQPASVEQVRDKLLNNAQAVAQATGMSLHPISRPNYLPGVKSNPLFHRARITIPFQTTEPALYQWLAQMNDPAKFQAVTKFSLAPNRDDKTKVDGEAQVEQWIIPSDKALEDAQQELGSES